MGLISAAMVHCHAFTGLMLVLRLLYKKAQHLAERWVEPSPSIGGVHLALPKHKFAKDLVTIPSPYSMHNKEFVTSGKITIATFLLNCLDC